MISFREAILVRIGRRQYVENSFGAKISIDRRVAA
jgi:hypothetical protein